MSEENKNELMEKEKDQEQSLDAFSSMVGMNNAWKIAVQLAKSTIVPTEYQNNPSNCLIALDMASRLNLSPMMVMQGLIVVKGKPTWNGQSVIALINGSRRYSAPLKFELEGSGQSLSCYAWTTDLEGVVIKGTKITMEMVKAEGWDQDKGSMKSKWKTMPEQMMQYRAASYFGRVNCPDVLYGLYTTEEIYDIDASKEVFKSNVPDTFNLEKEEIVIVEDKQESLKSELKKEEPKKEEPKDVDIPENEMPDFMKGIK